MGSDRAVTGPAAMSGKILGRQPRPYRGTAAGTTAAHPAEN